MANSFTGAQIRQKFIDYYKALGHVEIPQSPLVLKDDPTTLFTGSGMQQIVPYLLGKPHPAGKRLVNVQRCLRAEDLDEIGNARHHSFFEMLGVWSLGDYFKEEQIPWTFSFFVDELGIDPQRLYVTVFAGEGSIPKDTESAEIWKEVFAKRGIRAKDTDEVEKVGQGNYRIFYYPKKKNWWERSQAPIGDPAGPDTEIFYFTGIEHNKKFGEKCHVNCDCGRYIEIGNDVFMQYKKVDQNNYEELSQRNVDCGWGLERLTRVVQNKRSNYETDLFYPIIQVLQDFSKVEFGKEEESDKIYRICADHIRAAVFLIADGVVPSNKMQGYVLRRLLRRIIFQSQKLVGNQGVLDKLATVVIQVYGDYYEHLISSQEKIINEIITEEEKFKRTLQNGLVEMQKINEREGGLDESKINLLYESYGVPKELTMEIARERGYVIRK